MQKKSLMVLKQIFGFAFVFLLVLGLMGSFMPSNSASEKVSYSEFEKLVSDGKVQSVYMNPNKPNEQMIVSLNDKTNVLVSNPEIPTLKADLLKQGVEVEVGGKSFFSNGIVQIIIGFTIVSLILGFMNSRKQKNISGKAGSIKSTEEMVKTAKENKKRYTKFSEIAGNESVKEELWESISYLNNPKRFLEAGIRPPSGVLLYGPSGTGKTLLARAVAGEAGVPFFAISGSEFIEKYVGVGASRVRELFENARKVAPAVIFIDEIDALLRSRSANASDELVQTVNQFLTELDGFSSNNGLIVIGATNRKDSMDRAVLRPGRFDRHIEVDLPDKESRLAILELHARNKRMGSDVDFPRLAKQTTGFSGADLENLLNESALLTLRRNKKEVSWEEVQDAFEYVIVGSKKKDDWSEHEKKVVAYHEAGHALVTHMVAKQAIERITVKPAGNAGGYVMRSPKDRKLKTKKDFIDDIYIAMAGRVAESIIFGEENITIGAQQDFRQATNAALQMVFAYGMSDLGPIAVPNLDENMWASLSDDLKNKAQKEMTSIIQKAEKEVTTFLTENRHLLEHLTQHLLVHKTVDGEELQSVLDGHYQPKQEAMVAFDAKEIEVVSDELEVLAIDLKDEEK